MLCECRHDGDDANDEAAWYDARNDATWCSNAAVSSSVITGYCNSNNRLTIFLEKLENGSVSEFDSWR